MKHLLTAGRAHAHDLDAVCALYAHLIKHLENTVNYPDWHWGVYPSRAFFEDAAAHGALIVFKEDGRLIGAAVADETCADGYDAVPWQTAGRRLVLHAFAVDAALQGRGYALRALSALEDLARTGGYDALVCDTYATNLPARALYTRAGFTDHGLRELHYAQTDMRHFYLYEYPL